MHETVPPTFFEKLYATKADPWEFETSAYEHAKYDATLAALPRAKYSDALEIGCSIGVLTARLAARCDRLLSLDVAEAALARARSRCQGLENVQFCRAVVPADFPEDIFDLIVISEVAYYWSVNDLAAAKDKVGAHHSPSGHLLLVHWLPLVEDHAQSGDAVHETWLSDPRWKHVYGTRNEKYRLDLLERTY